MNRILTLIAIAITGNFFAVNAQNSQLILEEIEPESITVCLEPDTIELIITNPSGNTAEADSIYIFPVFPEGINWNGFLENAAVVDNSMLNEPIFKLPNSLSPGQSVTVRYSIFANCNIVQNVTDGNSVNNTTTANYEYNGSNNSTTLTGQGYNLLYADLQVFGVVLDQITANIGGTNPMRTTTLLNGGNGAVDTAIFTIELEPEVNLTDLYLAEDLSNFSQSGTTVTITLTGADFAYIGDLDSLWEQDEFIYITEQLEVTQCGEGNTAYNLNWGCPLGTLSGAEVYCNDGDANATTNANIDVPEGNPEIVYRIVNPVDIANYCGKDSALTFIFKNTGTTNSDYAKDLILEIISRQDGGVPYTFTLSDFQINGTPLDDSLITYIDTIRWAPPYTTNIMPGYRIDLRGNTNSAYADNRDGDTFFDDLKAGDSLIVTAVIHFTEDTTFALECPLEYGAIFGMPQAKWQSQCNTPESSNGWVTSKIYRAYSYPDAASLVDPILEPVDFVEDSVETFTFCTGKWYNNYSFFDCAIDSHYASIFLPEGYRLVGDSAWWISNAGDSMLVSATSSGNTIILDGGGESVISATEWNGCYKVDLTLSCDFAPNGIPSETDISWEMNYKCDDCDEIQRRACASETVHNHTNCSSGECDGILTTNFNADRTTFGWTDYTRTTRITASDTGINVNAAYPYDTVRTTSEGTVINTNFDNAFVEIYYNSIDTLFNWADGMFYIYNSAGTIKDSCAATPPQLVQSGNTFISTFNIPCSGILAAGDSISLEADWVVEKSSIFGNNRYYEIPDFRSRYFVERNDTVISCESWGERFNIYNVVTFPYADAARINGCDPVRINLKWLNWGGTNGDDFPNEFRNIGRLDSIIKFVIPQGYTYLGSSAYKNYSSSTNVSPYWVIDSSVLVTPSMSGDTLIFNEDWPLVDKSDRNTTPYTLVFFLEPKCDRNDTSLLKSIFNWTNYDYSLNDMCHDSVSSEKYESYSSPIIYNYLPNITLNTGLTTIDGFERNVRWTVQVCNQKDALHPNIGDADGVWLDLDKSQFNLGDISIDSIFEQGSSTPINFTYYGSDSSVFVEAGTVTKEACRNFIIQASYTNCETDQVDTIDVLSGWGCTYPNPDTLANVDCQEEPTQLMLRYKNANLEWEIVAHADAAVYNPCDTIPYEIELQSSAPATMYEVDFWLNLPQGVTLDASSVKYLYTLSNSTWQLLPPVSNDFDGQNPQGWHLSDIVFDPLFAQTGEAGYEDGGFPGSKDTSLNKIRLRFDLILECGFTPNDSIIYNASGVTNCNDSLDLRGFDIINIGLENTDSLSVNISIPDTLNCSDSSMVTVTVTNTGNAPTANIDTLAVTLPAELNYAGNASPDDPMYNTGKTWFWQIPADIPAGGSQTYTFSVATPDSGACTPVALSAYMFYGQNVSCGGVQCDSMQVNLGTDTTFTNICCDNPVICTLDPCFTADTVCLGDATCFVPNQSDGSHEWYFLSQSTGNKVFLSNDSVFCYTFPTADTFTVRHILTDTTGACIDSCDKEVIIREYPEGVIELLGCSPFCEGDSVKLTVNGTYDSIEWIKTPPTPGIIAGTNDTLTIYEGGIYTAVLFNGECVDSCLAIEVKMQDSPEVELPDTLICAGDSVWYAVTDTFTSIRWSTGDTSAGIWITNPGAYWVEVGDSLPNGCCTCYGRDTFNVDINEIFVTVPDTAICIGDSATLCATVTGGIPPFTYQWEHINNTILLDNTPCIAVSDSGRYAVTVTDALGCTATDTGTVTLDTLPQAFVFSDTVCIEDTICFDGSASGWNEWYVYDENSNLVGSNTQNANPFCYLFSDTGTYRVTQIVSNACGSDTATGIIEVVPPVQACIVLIGQNPFCEGDTVLLTINDPLNQVDTIYWKDKDGNILYIGDTLKVWEPGTFTASVVDNHGCISECMCIVLDQIPAPVVDLLDSAALCENGTVTLNADSGFEEYKWYKDGTPYAFDVSSITIDEAGIYKVMVEDKNGCVGEDSTIVEEETLNVGILSSRNVVCINDNQVMLATASNPNYTYQWYRRSVGSIAWTPILGANSSTVSVNPLVTTTYRVVVTDTISGCTGQAEITISVRIGRGCFPWVLAPNPASETVNISYNINPEVNAKVEIYTMYGEYIGEHALNMSANNTSIDISGYKPGAYIVKLVMNGTAIDHEKLIIMNGRQ